MTIVIVTAMPYAAASASDDSNPMTIRIVETIKRPVDLRDVDLSHLVRRRVLDVETRRVPELDGLLRQRERARD